MTTDAEAKSEEPVQRAAESNQEPRREEPVMDLRDFASRQSKGNGARVRDVIEHGAAEVATAIGRGVTKASDVLTAPKASELEHMMASTELPEIEGDDPLGAMAVRLDHEAEFWRSLALRALTRAAWADRTANFGAALAMLGCAALAIVTGLQAMFGAAPARAWLIISGAVSLGLGAAITAWVAASIRRSQREIATDALERAGQSEQRLRRVAVALALRAHEPASSYESLKRLETESATASPRGD